MGKNYCKKAGDWKKRRDRDYFANNAQSLGYRSRAAWKLIEINKKDRLIHQGSVVIDLGAAPGSWSQVALKETGATGQVVAVDRLPIEPLDNLKIIRGDVTKSSVRDLLRQTVRNGHIDLVLSDMAPNISGVRAFDQARCVELAITARDFALDCLRPGGCLVLKLFEGAEILGFHRETKELFETCVVRKPSASRSESSEFFLVARRASRA